MEGSAASQGCPQRDMRGARPEVFVPTTNDKYPCRDAEDHAPLDVRVGGLCTELAKLSSGMCGAMDRSMKTQELIIFQLLQEVGMPQPEKATPSAAQEFASFAPTENVGNYEVVSAKTGDVPEKKESLKPIDVSQNQSLASGPFGDWNRRMIGMKTLQIDEGSDFKDHLRKQYDMVVQKCRRLQSGQLLGGVRLLHRLDMFAQWVSDLDEPERTGLGARIIKSTAFSCLSSVVILIHAVFSGYQSEYEVQHAMEQNDDAPFIVPETCFLIFYSLEFLLRMAVHGAYTFVNIDAKWAIFDVILIVLGWSDVCAQYASSILQADMVNLTFTRSIRLLKIAKILRVLRLVRFLDPLKKMAQSLINTMYSLLWCFVMLFFTLYIFAMLFMQGLSKYISRNATSITEDVHEQILNEWGTMRHTLLTLYFTCTSGSWLTAYNTVALCGPLYKAAYIFFSGFFVISVTNILTGMFVDEVMKCTQPDRETLVLDNRKKDLSVAKDFIDMYRECKIGSAETISRDQFLTLMEDPLFACYLETMELDVKDTGRFFDMMQMMNKANEPLPVAQFAQGCMLLRGNAKNLDLQTMRLFIKHMFELQAESLQICHAKIDELIRASQCCNRSRVACV